MKNSSLTDPLDALESIIRWSHLAPTCPDTLGFFPYKDKDPFVLETLPRVLYAGNQDKFGQRVMKIDDKTNVLLLAIPKFSKSHSVISLNLKTLECEPLVFDYLPGSKVTSSEEDSNFSPEPNK